jgi:ABC-type multidrug transport system fused ATPase/permease subunit
MGLAGTMTESIQEQRETEIALSRKYRWIVVLITTIGNIPAGYGPVLTFIAFAIQARVHHENALSTNQAFTSLAILSLVTTPVQSLLSAAPMVAAGNGCMQRIQTYLLASSWEDSRLLLNEPSSASSVDPLDNIEMQRMASKSTDTDSIAVCVKNLTLQYNPTSEPILKEINMELQHGSLTMLIGPIG